MAEALGDQLGLDGRLGLRRVLRAGAISARRGSFEKAVGERFGGGCHRGKI
jgi:hypothetical protein